MILQYFILCISYLQIIIENVLFLLYLYLLLCEKIEILYLYKNEVINKSIKLIINSTQQQWHPF
jgi:hypothetical protein